MLKGNLRPAVRRVTQTPAMSPRLEPVMRGCRCRDGGGSESLSLPRVARQLIGPGSLGQARRRCGALAVGLRVCCAVHRFDRGLP